jgi:sugar phosphate isomerase/epimerase
MNQYKQPVIAVSNRPFSSSAALVRYVRDKGCGGVDYSFSFHAETKADLEKDIPWVEDLLAHGIEIRYHCPFHNMELADVREEQAVRSLAFFRECIDFASAFGGHVITVHIGLRLKTVADIDYGTAVHHLRDLVEYGARKEMTVCLENLTKGWTNDPAQFVEILDKTGAGTTFDLGHANACPWVAEGNGTAVDFLLAFADRVINAHVYEIEQIHPQTHEPYHQFPSDLSRIEPLLAELTGRRCDWWLIELSRIEEVEHTRVLLTEFLRNSPDQRDGA